MHERADKSSDEAINKAYAEYSQCELKEMFQKTGKAPGKHVIGLYLSDISQVDKIRNARKKLRMIQSSEIK